MKKTQKNQVNSPISWLVYFVALLAIFFLHLRYENTIKEHTEEFQKTAIKEAHHLKNDIAHKIQMLYQSLRTIARLPGTRSINHDGGNFDIDAKTTLQELYNNLYTNISLSELYIVSKGFDPDRNDPNSKKINEPIFTMDKFIVGRHAGKPSNNLKNAPVEEIEIYEYRLMRDQLKWLENKFPTEETISELNYPAISGPEVITCDNTFFSPHNPNDLDRSGLVYSVPFYGVDGGLEGIISGVVLTRVLQKLIPNGNYAIVNTAHDYIITPTSEGSWSQSIDQIKKGLPNESLFFSTVIDLPVVDKGNAWKLWIGRPMSDFYNLEEINIYKRNKTISILVVVLFAIGFHIIIAQQIKRRRFVLNQNEYLEKKVQERTQALTLTNDQLVKANDAKANFLSRVSHELRTPLNAIIGYSDLLRDEGFANESVALGDVEKIQSSGKHLLSLINEVLDISKIESGKMAVHIETFMIKEVIEEVITTAKPIAEKNSNTLIVSDFNNADTMTTDKLKIKQILINLLANACKYTQNGKITISVCTIENQDGANIKFEVADTGVGIDKTKLEHIFDEFYQAHATFPDMEAGSGLGLAICMRLANLLQGNLCASSELGKGSTFTLVLPKILNSCLLPSEIVMIDGVVQTRNVSL